MNISQEPTNPPLPPVLQKQVDDFLEKEKRMKEESVEKVNREVRRESLKFLLNPRNIRELFFAILIQIICAPDESKTCHVHSSRHPTYLASRTAGEYALDNYYIIRYPCLSE